LNWYGYCGNNPVMFIDPSGYLRTGHDSNGVWHDWDAEEFGKDSVVYLALVDLTTTYNMETTNKTDKNIIHDLAEECRRIGRLKIKMPPLRSNGVKGYYLNNVERVLSMAYYSKIIDALIYGDQALDMTAALFGGDGTGGGGENDAYRHMVWAAILTNTLGESFATLWLNAHEYGSSINFDADHILETRMDFHNNAIGISIGKALGDGAGSASRKRKIIGDTAYKRLLDGTARKVENGKLVRTNGGLSWEAG